MLYLFLLKLVLNDNSVPRNLKKKNQRAHETIVFQFFNSWKYDTVISFESTLADISYKTKVAV